MALTIRNEEADALARRLAEIDHSTIADAIVTALRETIQARRRRDHPTDTVRIILQKHGIALTETSRRPVDAKVWDDLHDDPNEPR